MIHAVYLILHTIEVGLGERLHDKSFLDIFQQALLLSERHRPRPGCGFHFSRAFPFSLRFIFPQCTNLFNSHAAKRLKTQQQQWLRDERLNLPLTCALFRSQSYSFPYSPFLCSYLSTSQLLRGLCVLLLMTMLFSPRLSFSLLLSANCSKACVFCHW